MALRENEAVPQEVVDAIDDLLKRIPPRELDLFASASPSFKAGGFRKGSTAAIRARIRQLVSGSEPITDDLRRLLSKHCAASAALSLLSETTIRAILRPLASSFGRGQLSLALALDPRLAAVSIPGDGAGMEADATSAAAVLSPLFALCGDALPDDAGAGRVGAAEAVAAAKAAAERDAAAKRKGLKARLEKEIAKSQAAEKRAAEAESRAVEAEKDAASIRRRAVAAEEALDFERRHAAELADANVEKRLADEFSAWLGGRRAAMLAEAARHIADIKPQDTDCHGSPDATPAPMRRLLAAMERQASADPASASRSFLEARLASYEKALSQASALISDSLAPSAELIAAHEALAEEAAHLSSLLGGAQLRAPSADIVSALEREAAKASERELPEVQHLARRLADMGVVADDDAAAVRERVRARYAALYAKRDAPDEAEASSPAGTLRRAVAEGEALVLLIDGHNALFALQSRYCRPQDHRGPPAEARNWLVADVAQMVSAAPNCRVVIVFDGPDRTESTPSGNVKVIYSGGGTSEVEHRADDVIVDELRFLSRSGAKMLLATNDNGLASRAAQLGAKSLPPTALLEYLR